MEQDNPIKITDTETIPGTHPLVIIGPNGSGKTQFGAKLSTDNDADLIVALRNIQINENIPMQNLTQARTGLSNSLSRRRSRYWEMSNEIDTLFSKLLAEDSQSAIKFRNNYGQSKDVKPEQTKIIVLTKLWKELFPGREIDFTTYSPKIRASHGGENIEYTAQGMSDGERVAVYLAGRVLDSEKRIIIIDEPEIHFHSRLSVKFWNKLEEIRPDCRFIYITHDLTFALSRQNAQYLIIQPNKTPELIPLDSELPDSIVQSILSAASFSIFARRIVFCEGKDESKSDYLFYSAWFNDNETVVIPVGSCSDVVQCSTAFGNSKIVKGVESLGIIDRDYWPDDYLSALPEYIYPLPLHEIENIYCVRGVFDAVANHLSFPPEQAIAKYSEFLEKAKAQFKNGLLCKQVSERFKRRCERNFTGVLNTMVMSDNLDQLKTQYCDSMKSDNWQVDPEIVFDEESKLIQESLTTDENSFLKILPGKNMLSIAANILGITIELYKELVHSALGSETDSKFSVLGKMIESALESYLPPRKVTEAPEPQV